MSDKPLVIDVNGHDSNDFLGNGMDNDLLSPRDAPKPCMFTKSHFDDLTLGNALYILYWFCLGVKISIFGRSVTIPAAEHAEV